MDERREVLKEHLKALRLTVAEKKQKLLKISRVNEELLKALCEESTSSGVGVAQTSKPVGSVSLGISLKEELCISPQCPVIVENEPWLCIFDETLVFGVKVRNKEKTVGEICGSLLWKENDDVFCDGTSQLLSFVGDNNASVSERKTITEHSVMRPNESAYLLVCSSLPSAQCCHLRLLLHAKCSHEAQLSSVFEFCSHLQPNRWIGWSGVVATADFDARSTADIRWYDKELQLAAARRYALIVHAACKKMILRIEDAIHRVTPERLLCIPRPSGLLQCNLPALRTVLIQYIPSNPPFLVVYDRSSQKLRQCFEVLSGSVRVTECRKFTVEAELEDVQEKLNEMLSLCRSEMEGKADANDIESLRLIRDRHINATKKVARFFMLIDRSNSPSRLGFSTDVGPW